MTDLSNTPAVADLADPDSEVELEATAGTPTPISVDELAAPVSHGSNDHEAQGYELVDLTTLTEHPKNPHIGDDDEVAKSIRENGFYGAIQVQRSTRYVCSGNTRLRAARKIGLARLPVIWLDISDERALAIVLADNRIAQLGRFDDEQLRFALEELSSLDMLDASGYNADFMADLQKVLDNVQPYAVPDPESTTSTSGSGGAIIDPGLAGIRDQYTNLGVRSLILDYPVADFEDITGRLKAARDALGLDSNTAVVLHLLAHWEATGAAAVVPVAATEDESAPTALEPVAETASDEPAATE